jgi:hypothetical protein
MDPSTQARGTGYSAIDAPKVKARIRARTMNSERRPLGQERASLLPTRERDAREREGDSRDDVINQQLKRAVVSALAPLWEPA